MKHYPETYAFSYDEFSIIISALNFKLSRCERDLPNAGLAAPLVQEEIDKIKELLAEIGRASK